jgi:hypothetical protein
MFLHNVTAYIISKVMPLIKMVLKILKMCILPIGNVLQRYSI